MEHLCLENNRCSNINSILSVLIERRYSSTLAPDILGMESGNNGGVNDDTSDYDSDKWDDSFLKEKEHQQQKKLVTIVMFTQQ